MTSSFKKNVILLFSETFKNDEILRFEILKFSSEKPPLVSQHFENWKTLCFENPGFKKIRPAAGGKFWGFWRVFYAENASRLHSGTCFWIQKHIQNEKKFRLRRACYHWNPLSKSSQSAIFSRLRRAKITVFENFMLVYIAPLDKHKTLELTRASKG